MTDSEEPQDVYSNIHDAFEKGTGPHYILRLYVTGATPQSIKAITNIKKICEQYLRDRYALDIIDIYQQPHLADDDQIVAAPTLVKAFPVPIKKLIGDMSNTERVLQGLDVAT